MPGNILNADTGFPQFTGDETSDQKIDKVMNYLYMLLEQLRYTLNNLDGDNFNETGLREIADGIARPLQTSFENEFAKTNALIEGWSGEYGSQIALLTDWKSDASESISNLQISASENAAQIALLTDWKGETSSSIASLQSIASNQGTQITAITSWQSNTGEKLVESVAILREEADETGAALNLLVTYDSDGNVDGINAAEIAMAVSEDESFIRLIADNVKITGFVTYESLENDGESYINGNNIGLVSDSDGESTASLRFWLEDDIRADENDYLIGEIYTSGTNNDLQDCTLHVKTSTSDMKITSGGNLDVSSALALSLESGTSYVEVIADGSVEIYSGDETMVDCDYMTIIPSVGYSSSRGVDYAWQFFDDGIYYNGYKVVSTPS